MGDDDRDAILARRSRWIRIAMNAATAGTLATSCACLSMAADTGTAEADAGPDAGEPLPCLSPPAPDAGEPEDAGDAMDAAVPTDSGVDSGLPMPCLTPLPDDAGQDAAIVVGFDGSPLPCLTLAPDSGPVDE